MRISLITPPAVTAVSLDEAKEHLRVSQNSHDALITDLLAAAIGRLDGRRGVLGRALITQQWSWRIDRFPIGCMSIAVPFPPLQSVQSITYLDEGGVAQTLESAKYTVVTDEEPGLIQLALDEVWPATQDVPGAITIAFTAGYGADPSDVPASIRSAIKMMILRWYDNPEGGDGMPAGAEALLETHRIHTF